ncbi:glycosyltransferase family 4 protein [Paenibacillaceae bacterium WGS1546]|uniref:glycosyltransferase family 4 protein n=1 Tax=Cohnella sp. WGS1546 TaxID=3366810 RepID=UPI00372D28D5
MRLALICTEKLPVPSIRGGAIQIMIDGVVPQLAREHDVTVYSITDPDLPQRERRNGIRYIRYPANNYVEHVARSLSGQRYDVVHVFNRPKHVPRYKAASPRSKFVVSLHNEMFAVNKLSDEEARNTLRAVEKIMTVSDYIGSTVTSRFPAARTKVRTVYSGFDADRYVPVWSEEGAQIRSRLRRKYGVSGKKVILFVGRLSDKKGPHLLIRALEQVLAKHRDAVLVIVGGKWFSQNSMNDYVRYLYARAKPYGNRIIFTQFVPASEIPDYFLMGDVFVCSSQWQEPLARVHYEAMASGIPIITTNRGGNAEVIRHRVNGLIVNRYQSATAFAQAINYMFSNPDEAKEMAYNGRRFVKSDFTFVHVANRLNNVYKEALGVAMVSLRKERR